MNRDEYRGYLRSEHWRDFREAMLWIVGFQCQDCGSFARLDVHHLHYRTLGAEGPDDVRVLCRPCHRKAHGLVSDAIGRLDMRAWLLELEWVRAIIGGQVDEDAA